MRQDLPQSARNALARQAATDEHPSADLLSAFAEQALSTAQKQQVTTHLAACAECREVAFLASAAAPPPQQAPELLDSGTASRRRWVSWKWIAPLAAVVVIAVGIVPMWRKPTSSLSTSTVALDERSTFPQSRPSAATSYQTTTSASPASDKKARTQEHRRSDKDMAFQARDERANNELSSTLAVKSLPAMNQPSAAPPSSSSQEKKETAKDASREVGSAAPLVAAKPASPVPLQEQAAASYGAPREAQPPTAGVVTKAAPPPPTPLADAVSPAGQSAGLFKMKNAVDVARVHWRITNDGQLQH
jgi:hypothetical protein